VAVISDIDLDHVAVAAEAWTDLWPRYRGDLGGEWVGGGPTIGFASAQVRYANTMRLEVLEPHAVDQNDFLRRFLDRNGPGPHHLTFKVEDIRAALGEAEAAGFEPVGVDLRDPHWQEAFLHPKQARGVVVQLAQSDHGDDDGEDGADDGEGGWGMGTPDGFPDARIAPATFDRIVHLVASLDDGLALFAGLLAGQEQDRGEAEGVRWVDLAWPGPGRLRLAEPTTPDGPQSDWLGDRAGRIHHLAFTCDAPADVGGARPLADGRWEVPPEANLGVRLLLTAE
jgi:methylmalonyl-CoA/ethylmalonyl-CoA epimerase